MSDNQLNTIYRQAALKVEFDPEPRARLFINNIKRQERAAEQTPCTLRLSSSVQTDYEWHESIEAIVNYEEDQVSVRLTANHTQLAARTFHRTVIGKPP